MKLAIFDLDNTLIAGDSDALWGEYLVERGVYDAETYGQVHRRFYQAYMDGNLDIQEFLHFQMDVLGKHPFQTLSAWRSEFLQRKIKPLILPKAQALTARHRDQGHELLIITATNRFITEPIAEFFEITELIACEPEIQDGEYTGFPTGTPSFAEGKVSRLQDWLLGRADAPPGETWFYSDSHNDLPLLRQVTHPVAVDPDARLAAVAQAQKWPIISLRT